MAHGHPEPGALPALHAGPDTGGRCVWGGDARVVLHHGALALQVVLVDGALLLLLQTALLLKALILGAAPPDTRVAHHT